METKEILIAIIVIIITGICLILILNQFSPFIQCKDKPDDFIVKSKFNPDQLDCKTLLSIRNVTNEVNQ